jgi:hypothetical protein
MIRAVAIAFFLVCTAGPVWAAEVEPFNPEAPFQQGLSTSLLRSLLNEALDRFEDHIEILGKLDPGDVKGDQKGRLQFKFYPEGKSKSGEHLAAEGWFHVAPDHTLRDFYFRFKHPEESLKHSFPQSGEVL